MSLRILISNDDGINAPGLQSLIRIAQALTDDIWVFAPETEQSGASRSLTLHDPIRVRKVADRRFAVSGTPSDAVLMGLQDLIPGKQPDLVLSGVNKGQNIAEDISVSGTVAAALQGMQLGVPAIALSQAYGFGPNDHAPFETAEAHGPEVIRRLLDMGWPRGVVMNVNFPDRAPEDVQGIEITRQGMRDQVNLHAQKRTDLRGVDYFWLGFHGHLSKPPKGVDLRAVYEGRISITPIHIDMTHDALLEPLREAFGRG